MRQALLCLAILALFTMGLTAAPVASIKGYVRDSSGAVVPNAAVELRNTATNIAQQTKSDDSGFYQFLQLNPGKYEVSTEAPGFRKSNVRGIDVLVDQIVSLDIKLDVGQVSETVEVSGAQTALVETERISTGTNLDPKMVTNLPTANRRFNDLAILTPGVTFSASGTQAGGFAAAGSRAQSTNWMIDGVNALDPQVNGPLNSFRIADAVQELSVMTSAWSAEFGRQSGAQVNVVTKSGTNQFHGTAFWFIRNDALNAADFFTNKVGGTKNILRRNQYGLTFGGPIIRDKTFFFYSWEALQQKNPLPTTGTVPTQAQRDAIRDPIAREIVKFFPLPTLPNAAAGSLNYVGNLDQSANDNTHLVRIDHTLTSKDRLSGRYIWFGGDTLAAVTLPNNGTKNTPGSQTLAVSDVHTFSPTFFAELRAGYSRNKTDFKPQDWGLNAADVLKGVPGVVDATKDPLNSGLPRVQIAGYALLGGATNLPQGRITNSYELFANFTKQSPFGWTRHTMKFGYAGRREETRRFLNGNSRGQLVFAGWDQFAGVCSTCGNQSLLQRSQIRTGDTLGHWYRYPHAFYLQDDIKVKPNFTLKFGLRYELPEVSVEKNDRATNFIDGVGPVLVGTNKLLDLDPTKRGRDAFIYRDAGFTLSRSGTQPDRNNFGPVVGFAYTPKFAQSIFGDGKTVIRGGFRVGFDEVFNNVPVNQTLNAPWVLTTEQRAGATQPSAGFGWNVAFDQNVPLVARTTQAPGAPAVGLVAFNGYDPNAPTSYAYNWNFSVQREITRTASVEVSYIGTAGHKLGIFIDANEPNVIVRDPGRRGDQAPNEQVYPFPQWGSLRGAYATFQGNSSFHGLVISGKIRAASMLTMNSSYTWGHAIDNSSAFFGSDDDAGVPVTRNRLDLERANSGNDQRHRFINLFVFDVPYGKGRRFGTNLNPVMNQVLGGWSLSAITNLTTGHPFTVFANTAVDFSGFNQLIDRPDAGQGTLKINRGNPDAFFDPAWFGKTPGAFCPGSTTLLASAGCAPVGRVGTLGRNAFYGPGLINVDMTVSKSFPIRERVRLEYRADFFNVMNHTNFALVGANRSMNNGQFGQLGSTSELNGGNTGGPRVIQMTLRVVF
jgi:hypothetical protein